MTSINGGPPITARNSFRALPSAGPSFDSAIQNPWFQSLMDSLPACVAYIDRDERYRLVSRLYENWCKRPRSEIIGQTIQAVFGSAFRQRISDHLAEAFASGQVHSFVEQQIRYPDGDVRDVKATLSPHRDDSGNVVGLFVHVTDISELMTTQRRFAATLKAGRVGSWEWNVQTGHFWWSDTMWSLFGFANEDHEGSLTRFFARLVPPDRRRLLRLMRSPETARVLDEDFMIRLPNGEERSLRFRATLQFDKDGQPIVVGGTCADTTRIKQSEQESIRNEQIARARLLELEQIYRLAPVGLALLDRDLRYVKINDTLARIHGVPAEVNIGRTLHDSIPAIANEVESHFRDAIDTLQPVLNREVRGMTNADPTREHVWLESYLPLVGPDNEILGVQVAVQDVTEMRHAEAMLRSSHAKLQALSERLSLVLESLPMCTFTVDIDDPHAKYTINQNCCTIFDFGNQKQTWNRQSWLQRVHSKDRADVEAAIDQLLQQGTMEVTYRWQVADGSYRWITESARQVTLPEEDGHRHQIIGMWQDISERKQAELDLHHSLAELARMGRLHLLRDLSTEIAHELNQPLTAITLQSGVARQHVKGVARQCADDDVDLGALRLAIREIEEQAIRAGEIIRTLRELSRKSEPVRQPIAINALVAKVLHFLDFELHAKGVRVETFLSPDDPKVMADHVQLQQVLLNLVQNAIDALTTRDVDSRNVTISTSVLGRRLVRISVIDSGPGLASDNMQSIFESFFSTKPNSMGVGLSISRSIVTALGGTIEATNSPGGGARFDVDIPSIKSD